ncbi:MAG: hypothetical protein ACYCZN_15605 [Candidatus Dormibacteria bacterium]
MLTFYVVAVDANSGKVVDMVGSNAQADGSPLPLGSQVSCGAPAAPSP